MTNLIVQPPEPDIIEAASFGEVLAAMPNVGTDADFERIQSNGAVMMEYKQQRDDVSAWYCCINSLPKHRRLIWGIDVSSEGGIK